MLGLGLSLAARASKGVPAPASYALSLDFASADYWRDGVRYAPLSAFPGYSFARAGEQGAVDASGAVQWFAANDPAINGNGYHVHGALTNVLLNAGGSANLTTQTVTVSAQAYTLAFIGTGTVTLSGVSTAGPLVGTGAADQVRLNFTPTAGSLTLTVSGTVEYAVLVAGAIGVPVPIIRTEGTTASIGASDLEVGAALPNGDFIAWIVADRKGLPTAAKYPLAYSTAGAGTLNERLNVAINTNGTISMASVAGGVSQPVGAVIPNVLDAVGGRFVVMVRRKNGVYSLAAKRVDGVVVIGADAAGAATLPAVNAVEIGSFYDGTSQINGQVEGFFQRNGTFSDAEITAILQGA